MGMQPKYGHHDDAYMLPERCRQALSTQARAGLSEESDYGLVKLTQNINPEQADELNAGLSGPQDLVWSGRNFCARPADPA